MQQINSKTFAMKIFYQLYFIHRLKFMGSKNENKKMQEGSRWACVLTARGKAQGRRIFFAHLPQLRCTVSSPIFNDKMSV